MRDRIAQLGIGGLSIDGRTLVSYRAFLDRIARDVAVPGANVVVVGYPAFVEDPKFWPNINKMTNMCQGIREADALKVRGLAGLLNRTIADAVNDLNRQAPNRVRFTFVDVNSGQPDHMVGFDNPSLFEPNQGDRHNLCARRPWLNGITLGGFEGDYRRERSFHPTQEGHDAQARLVAARVQRLGWERLDPPAPAGPQGLEPAGLSLAGAAPLRFGDPTSKGEQVVGRKAERCSLGGTSDTLEVDDKYSYLSFDNPGGLEMVVIKAPSLTTPEGARVGMTAAELARRLPGGRQEMLLGARPAFVVRGAGRSMVFWLTNGVADTIVIGPSWRAEDVGDC
jgi:hypothetical protein